MFENFQGRVLIKLLTITILLHAYVLQAQNVESMINFNDSVVCEAFDYYQRNEFERAKEHLLEYLISENNNTEARYLLSLTLNRLGELDEAIEEAEKTIEINNDNAQYHYTLAQFYIVDARTASIYRTPALIRHIIDELETTIKIDSNHTKAIYDLGYVYSDVPGVFGGDVDKAFELANKLLSLDEKHARYLLSKIHLDNNDKKKEEDEYKILEEHFGNDEDIYRFYNSYGYLLLKQGRVDEAISKFKKQVELAPDDWRVFDSLGEAYLVRGEDVLAVKNYRKSLELNPENQTAIRVLSKYQR